MKAFLVLGILALLPLAARANDSSFEGVGGTARPTRGENKAIRMKSEVVVLTAGKNDFSTRADFVFQNETASSQSVQMGFPEGNFGDVSSDGPMKDSGFKSFATWVDEKRIGAKRTILKHADDSGFDTYWLKTVSFAPHQTRRVRVEFRSPYGGNANRGFSNAMSYAFTGKNWRGDVGESRMEVRVPIAGLWRAVATGNGEKPLPFSLKSDARGAIFRRTWKNWDAQENVTFGLERAVAFWRVDATGPDNGQLALQAVEATRTVRVGARPKTIEASDGFPADGFTRDGVLYVGVGHIKDRVENWGYNQKPKFDTNLDFSAKGFDLRAGTLRLQGREGEATVQINGKTIKIGAPVVAVPTGSIRLLYVPLAPIARALGWTFSLQGERLFSLQRGSWRG